MTRRPDPLPLSVSYIGICTFCGERTLFTLGGVGEDAYYSDDCPCPHYG